MAEAIDMKEVGARMQQAAEAKGLGAYDIAAALGPRAPTVYRWFSGESRPSIDLMNRFAALVERSAAWLWTGQEPLEEVLLRWARLAQSVGGSEALAQVRREGAPADAETVRLLDQFAPGMLAILAELGGADWPSQPQADQLALMTRLLARLREWQAAQEK
jgi:AcrR family transcriptional regulator